MDNHFHLLVDSSPQTLSALMQRTGTSYAQRYNGRHGHVGKLLQNRFHSQPVVGEEHLLSAIRYIHLNCRDAGVRDPALYAWSSYRELMGFDLRGVRPLVRDGGAVLEMFGGRDSFERFHLQRGVHEELVRIDGYRRRMDDGEAREIIASLCGESRGERIAELPKTERDAALAKLKMRGLSVRQVERLTGIGRNIVAKAK